MACPADRVDLLDPQQAGRSQDGGVRQPAEVLLRRGGQRDGFDAGGEGRDNVHDHGGRVDRQPAGYVESDTRHRNPVLADDRAVAELNVSVRRALGVGETAGAPDGFLQGRPYGRVEPGEGVRQCFDGDARVRLLDAVEAAGQLT